MAKKKNIGYKDLKGSWEGTNKEVEENLRLMEDLTNSFSKIFSLSTKLHLTQERINASAQKMSNIVDAQQEAREKGLSIGGYAKKQTEKTYNLEKNVLRNLEKKQKIQQGMLVTQKLYSSLLGTQSNFYKYIMDADAAVRSTNISLGLSGEKAVLLRENFYQAGQDSAMLGATLKNMASITTGFANETGRARVFSGEMLNDITEMGLGTGMGIEGAAQLAGQFDLMGVNISDVHQYTQDVVGTSERMGVNTTKVFKNITGNFKALQKMSFQQGVKGMAQMATYAEKFKVDMGQMINSADQARTLKGAVEMAAELQIMGGEFAKSDPFELLFLSRNDPAAYTKKINEMTKGVVTWKKNADGGFEKFISPADRDRLEAAGKAMGLQSGELITQARRMADITKMRGQMSGLGLNKDEMTVVEGMANVGENGIFQVQVGGDLKDISKLTKDEIKVIKQQSISLKERAEQALTFDKAFEATINNFKASLLPLLNGVNATLDFIRPLLEKGGFLKEYGGIIASIGVAVGGLWAITKTWSIMSAAGGVLSTLFSSAGKAAATTTISGSQALGAGKGAAAAGRGSMMRGAGVGAGALGIGAGIGVAAAGISTLSDSLKDLDVDKIYAMNLALGLVGVTIAGTLIGAVLALGAAGTVSAPGILSIGAAALGIGAGVGIAAAGIGYMAEGFSKLVAVDLSSVAGNILSIGAAAGSGGFLAMFGMGGMAGTAATIATIASNAGGMERVGNAFNNIGVVMSGNISQLREVKNIIESIASAKVSSGNPLSQLATLLSKPLMVEFKDKEVALGVELSLDSEVIYNKVVKTNIGRTLSDTSNLQKGKSA